MSCAKWTSLLPKRANAEIFQASLANGFPFTSDCYFLDLAKPNFRDLAAQGMQVRVGMEASGQARWFERLLSELHFELWIGDAADIRTRRVRKQKTDRQDAQLILQLMLEDRFPKIWVPSWENRDLRQLLWHRHRMVQARTRIMNQLQAVALNEGLRCKKRLWRTERPTTGSYLE